MGLSSGTSFGPYQLISPLGAGGMGEVYRARDSRLGRDVALKVINAEAASNPDRLARFEKEARAAAALNHPNIVAVFDIGASSTGPFIVTELLEGETLGERLRRGKVPLRQALDITAQIARGLAAAHDKGIVHRDLKPHNVFLTRSGVTKVLDFGLAKLTEAGTSTRPDDSERYSTEPGVVMGTAGYMSPEQVRGEPADHRADIFALGCVLYELITGHRAFSGASQVETMHAILTEEPPEIAGAPGAPLAPGAERIVRRCVEKEPSHRFQSARDLAFALEAVADARSSAILDSPPLPGPLKPIGRYAPWALAAILAITLVYATRPRPEPPLGPRFQFDIAANGAGDQIAISPQASQIASVATGTGTLAVHTLGDRATRSLSGTEGSAWPFWSPDGRSIGFFANGALHRVDLDGGSPQSLAAAPAGAGASWNSGGVIVFAPDGNGPLFRVSADGGAATPLTTLSSERGEIGHRHPWFLPDGRHFLYTAIAKNPVQTGIFVGSLDGGEPQFVVMSPSNAAFALPNRLLFFADNVLVWQRFDPAKLQASGEPQPLSDDVATVTTDGTAAYSVANNVVAYRLRQADGVRVIVNFPVPPSR